MKIDPSSAHRPSSLRRKDRTGAARPGDFAKELASDGAAPGGVSGPGSLGPLDALLALQEVPDSLARNARARRRGEALLDQLEQLRLDILTGALPEDRLARLAGLIAERKGEIDDPRLADILQEIELRAAVELAKRGG